MRTNLLTKIVPVILAGGGYSDKVLGYSPIAYWPLWEASGATAKDISGNGFDGAYTGVTLGQEGIGDGSTCPLFDGTNDYVNIYSAGFAGALNGAEGTASMWVKVFNAGIWLDGNERYCIDIRVGANDWVNIYKASANNRIFSVYRAGGVSETIQIDGLSSTGWFHISQTWSASAGADGEFKTYIDGVQQGVTATSLGIWAGTPHASWTAIGAQNITPTKPWNGYIAHCAVFTSPLTSDQIADLASV
jgi:hypothetical protein